MATFVIREVLAVCFVGVWLLLFVGELVTGVYALPFWFHCVAVGVLGYALGVNVAELTAYRQPTVKGVAKAVKARRSEE